MLRLAVFLAALALPSLASAEVQHCRAEVNGQEVVVDYENDEVKDFSVSRRESLSRLPQRTWNWAWGTPPTCNSTVLIEYLGQALAADEIDDYCLDPSEGSGFILVPGERTYRGRCAKTTCERVNTTAREATNLAGFFAGTLLGTNETGQTLKTVTHSTGATYLLGNGSALSGAFQSAGGAVATALSAPTVLAATAASVAVVGGVVYVCSD